MQLSRTNSGNWAKQVTITGGSKWRFVGNFATREQAEAAAAIQETKGRNASVTEKATSNSGAKKQYERAIATALNEAVARGLRGDELRAVAAAIKPLTIGQAYFRVEAYIAHSRQVMTHASAAECIAAGKKPGPCNL